MRVAAVPPLNTNVNDPRRGNISTPVVVYRGPNPNLQAETSTNEFYGIVFEPPFVKGLSLSVNYYRTIQKDAIQSLSQATILNNESLFPDRVVRLAATPADIAANQPGAIESLTMAESSLASALGRFQVVAESYPELKADQTMRDLSEELSSTENRVGFARQAYNDSVMVYNTARETFPTVVIANTLGFTAAELFKIEDPTERNAPKVSFN